MGWFLGGSKTEKKAKADQMPDNETSSGGSMLVLGWTVVLVATAGLWAGGQENPLSLSTHISIATPYRMTAKPPSPSNFLT